MRMGVAQLLASPASGEGLLDQLRDPAIAFDGAAPMEKQVGPVPTQVAYAGALERMGEGLEAAGEGLQSVAESFQESAEKVAEKLGEGVERAGEALGNLADHFSSFLERIFGN